MGEDVGHDPHLSAHTLGHVLEEGDILADDLLPHKRQGISQAINKIVVAGPWDRPS